MVSYIPRTAYDDDVFNEIQQIKNTTGLNWAQFIALVSREYKERKMLKEENYDGHV